MRLMRTSSIRVSFPHPFLCILPFDEHGRRLAIDFIQEHILRQGDQSNESALEQMKDEQISDAIRRAYKSVTGHELPVKDK